MTEQQIKNSFFIAISLIVFFADLSLFALLQHHTFLLLHCFVIVLMSYQHQKRIIFPSLLLLSIISYLDQQIFGYCLIYMIPTLWLAKFLEEHLYIKKIIPYSLLTSSLLLKYFILNVFQKADLPFFYFLHILTNNIVVLMLLLILYKKIIQSLNMQE